MQGINKEIDFDIQEYNFIFNKECLCSLKCHVLFDILIKGDPFSNAYLREEARFLDDANHYPVVEIYPKKNSPVILYKKDVEALALHFGIISQNQVDWLDTNYKKTIKE